MLQLQGRTGDVRVLQFLKTHSVSKQAKLPSELRGCSGHEAALVIKWLDSWNEQARMFGGLRVATHLCSGLKIFCALWFFRLFCLHVCLCIMCLPGTCRDQKWASDLLELELWAVVNPMSGLGTKLQSCVRASNAPSLQPPPLVFKIRWFFFFAPYW